jgi:pyruvate/2-oxoglutarate dehydrogenase complex dihydrolipoamide acyltransferase (E2) component
MTVSSKTLIKRHCARSLAKSKPWQGARRDGKVKPDDVEGSTFSTSNLGMYDVEEFHRHRQPA